MPDRSAATTEPLYVSVRYVRLRRSYTAVHRSRDCRQLVKGARKIAELPSEWAGFLPACTACFPRGAWRMETPAPPELFAWYMEAHHAA